MANFEILYWHWIVLGAALFIFEILLSSFFILWFGAAAMLVGVLLLVFPGVEVQWQILIWTLLSLALAIAWFKYLKPLSIDRTKAGLSREAIVGEVGQVIVLPNGDRRGTLRFPAPILGDDEWLFISDDTLVAGDKVRVIDVSGNALIVNKF